ncbi:hypothetical protein [Alicyclobacillus sp.]|uniref:hypothetical protein n=1 Tax=Alicyclobacillus sp. TaxID=61169 RepID=UPI0025B85C0C|nr:hypothetical protein [Alicyclobacillus sp.]MCL6516994.1 hypothetical protein [Alicyclobacillus sp.]
MAAALRSRGTHVSARKVAQVLDSEGLMYAHQRMDRLEQLVLQGRIEPDEEQIRALERYDPCFQERGRTGTRPGERILVFTCGPVAAGRSADGIRIPAYAHFAIDTCTGMTFGLVQAGNSALGRELLIQAEVLPFFKRHGYSVVQVDHLGQRAPRSPFVTRMLKEVLPAWLQSTPGHTEVTVGELQHRLDAVLDQYNHRPLEGFPNLGQPPICRLRAATEGGKENRARMQK